MQRMQRATEDPRECDGLLDGRNRGVGLIDGDHDARTPAQLTRRYEERRRHPPDHLLHRAAAEPAPEAGMVLAAEHQQRRVRLTDHGLQNLCRGARAHDHRLHNRTGKDVPQGGADRCPGLTQGGQLHRLRKHAGAGELEGRAHVIRRVHQPARHSGKLGHHPGGGCRRDAFG